ncbi:MAG: hypothetical protein NTY61_02290 [Candidatus Parcubacteria bacterium]|nr:hypothetical protein [Candidatus Parcubacteria bacterium]
MYKQEDIILQWQVPTSAKEVDNSGSVVSLILVIFFILLSILIYIVEGALV